MITRFYVDNYKCLQNFEYKPSQLELIVGANGTGKTTVFEALDKVRRFVSKEADANELFNVISQTRWSRNFKQIFEVDYLEEGNLFQYRLEINSLSMHSVEKEVLKKGDEIVFETFWEEKKTGQRNLPLEVGDEGYFNFLHNHVRVVASSENEKKAILSNYKESAFAFFSRYRFGIGNGLTQSHLIKINPATMNSQVGKVEPRPAKDLANFASYYLYLLQQKQGKMFEMIPHLREAIPDFDSFAVEEDFEAGRRDLRVVCRAASTRSSSSTVKYGFEEMSDGQRALIALYTLLFCTLEPNSTLIIDEPENYIALRELQPWLMLLQERLEEYGGQVILISHHPEFINALAPSHTTVFEREIGGPVRIKPFNMELAKSLTPAEVMARGWENE